MLLDTRKQHIVFIRQRSQLDALVTLYGLRLGRYELMTKHNIEKCLARFDEGRVKVLFVAAALHTGWRSRLNQHQVDIHVMCFVRQEVHDQMMGRLTFTYHHIDATGFIKDERHG